MIQKNSNSNYGEFKNRPAVSQILYREPTQAEMKSSHLKNFISNFAAALVLFICFTSVLVIGLKSCADEQEYNSLAHAEMMDKKGAAK